MTVSVFSLLLIWISLSNPSKLDKVFVIAESNSLTMNINYKPVGIFHTPMTRETGAPRQGSLKPENKAEIEIFDEYDKALRDLEECDYIIVIYHLNQSEGWRAIVTPPNSRRSYGLFATRSPFRPNPIGFGVINLDRVEGNILHVSGVDAFDGTPVLDIKPFLPSIDCPGNHASREMEKGLGLE